MQERESNEKEAGISLSHFFSASAAVGGYHCFKLVHDLGFNFIIQKQERQGNWVVGSKTGLISKNSKNQSRIGLKIVNERSARSGCWFGSDQISDTSREKVDEGEERRGNKSGRVIRKLV